MEDELKFKASIESAAAFIQKKADDYALQFGVEDNGCTIKE